MPQLRLRGPLGFPPRPPLRMPTTPCIRLQGQVLTVELSITDGSGTRRRVVLSSSFADLKATPLHCQVRGGGGPAFIQGGEGILSSPSSEGWRGSCQPREGGEWGSCLYPHPSPAVAKEHHLMPTAARTLALNYNAHLSLPPPGTNPPTDACTLVQLQSVTSL